MSRLLSGLILTGRSASKGDCLSASFLAPSYFRFSLGDYWTARALGSVDRHQIAIWRDRFCVAKDLLTFPQCYSMRYPQIEAMSSRQGQFSANADKHPAHWWHIKLCQLLQNSAMKCQAVQRKLLIWRREGDSDCKSKSHLKTMTWRVTQIAFCT